MCFAHAPLRPLPQVGEGLQEKRNLRALALLHRLSPLVQQHVRHVELLDLQLKHRQNRSWHVPEHKVARYSR